jgi:general secretion pathway protein J
MKSRGFTLIEIMVAVAILAMAVVMVFSSMRTTFKTKAAVEAQSGRYRTVRLALERLTRELSMAYISQNEDTFQQERRTFFQGKRHADYDEVRFSYFGHQRLYADGRESDTAQVVYICAPDREDSRRTNLLRRETRRLSNLKPDEAPGETDIVCDDIVKFRLEYWDARDKQWREEWVTTAADGQPDRLPSRVRVTLTVHDERGKEVPFQTEARLAIQEPLNSKPNDQQMPGAPPLVGATTGGGTTGGTTAGTTTGNFGRGQSLNPLANPLSGVKF